MAEHVEELLLREVRQLVELDERDLRALPIQDALLVLNDVWRWGATREEGALYESLAPTYGNSFSDSSQSPPSLVI